MPTKKVRKGFLITCAALLFISVGTNAELASSMGDVSAGSEALVAFKLATRAKYDMKEAAFKANDIEPIINNF
ncbi:MAG: hypothetical protein HN442_01025 [Halieaceae bacterium]|nr:hypothetical protein [Halieaceae bacterium]